MDIIANFKLKNNPMNSVNIIANPTDGGNVELS